MDAYIADKFKSLSVTPLGERLWIFLNQPDMVIRMQAASDLRKPAAEILSDQLLSEFGDEVRANRVKQMIGHMIKQVMVTNGYSLDRTDVKVNTIQTLFTKAARYKKA